jgi:hypothetical protein
VPVLKKLSFVRESLPTPLIHRVERNRKTSEKRGILLDQKVSALHV